ncbi:hypothetical protein RhiirA5_408709 [Rhizophagus irregularis]|uniref:Galactose oxidase n=1 Tax=Rhizophagus irregularis TaxID=588596 RepID=A0A2N0Q7J4_9GLOM|nr:hypothetical protein RhiirA5_408709 [Rhizophagus irregularis]
MSTFLFLLFPKKQPGGVLPSQRYLHTVTLIDNNLYIIGGQYLTDTSIEIIGKEFICLDVSNPFNTWELSWENLTDINMVPPHIGAASAQSVANMFLYGGISTNNDEKDLIYIFDTRGNSTNSWITLNAIGETNKAFLTSIDNDGKMYLFGGKNKLNDEILNDMLIFDTITLTFTSGSLVNASSMRTDYGAVLLPNKNIIYLGGSIINNEPLTLNEVYLYDTIQDNWSIKTTSGYIPSRRFAFSAVLSLDGQKIIIFGGKGTTNLTALYELDVTNFNWYIPKVSGQIQDPRYWHKANVIGKYMVISFGCCYDQSIESDILLLDISNDQEYVWTTNFEPHLPSPLPTQVPTQEVISLRPFPSSSVLSPIMGTSITVFLLTIICIYAYKWTKLIRNMPTTNP